MGDFTLEIDYYEIKKPFSIEGKEYSAICAISIDFDIEKDEDHAGFFYRPIGVEFDIHDVAFYHKDDEIPESDITEEMLDCAKSMIDTRDFNERIVYAYREQR